MAKAKKKAAKSRPASKRPNRMNGAARSRKRRRMNAANQNKFVDAVSDTLQTTGGVVLGMIGIGLAKDMIPNYYGRAAAVGAVGLAGAIFGEGMVRKIGIGIAAGAGAGATIKALQGTKIAEAMNGAKRLTPQQMRALADGLRKQKQIGRQPGTLTGQPDTLNGAMNGAGWQQINATWQ